MSTLLIPAFNFCLVLAILFVVGRKPVSAMLESRYQKIKGDLDLVRELLRKAQSQHEEAQSKRNAIGAEVRAIQENGTREIERTKQEILGRGKALAAELLEDASSYGSRVRTEMKQRLVGELGVRVVDQAQQMFQSKVTGEDLRRFREVKL